MRRRGVGSLTRLHPGAHPLIIYASSFTFLFWFLTFFMPVFHFFLCAISPLCHLSPLRLPCNATDGLCERWGRSQRISIYLTPACPLIFLSQLDLSHTSASYCCLAAGSRPRARLDSLSSCHHYPGPLLGISQHPGFAFLQFGLLTSKHDLKAHVFFCFFFQKLCVIWMLLDHLQVVYKEFAIIST